MNNNTENENATIRSHRLKLLKSVSTYDGTKKFFKCVRCGLRIKYFLQTWTVQDANHIPTCNEVLMEEALK